MKQTAIIVGIEIITCSIRQSRTPYEIRARISAPDEYITCHIKMLLVRSLDGLYSNSKATQEP